MAHLKRELCSWGLAILMACFIVNFVIDGVRFSFGILFEVFTDTFGKDAKTTAWIGSLMFSIKNFGGPIGSLSVRNFGCRITTILGSLLCFAGLILSAYVPNLYFLYFSIGFLVGFGMSLMHVSQTVILLSYFKTNRTFAVGLSILGAGLGGSVLTFLLNILNNLYSWSSLMLILSGILLQTTIAGVLMRPKTEPNPEQYNLKCEESATQEKTFKSVTEMKKVDVPYYVKKTTRIVTNETNVQNKSIEKGKHGEQKQNESQSCKPLDKFEQAPTKNGLLKTNSPLQNQLSKTFQIPKEKNTSADSCKTSVSNSVLSTYKELLTDAKVLLFLSAQSCVSFAIMIPFTFIPRVANDKGYSNYKEVWLLSSVNISNIVCRLLIGLIADRKFVNRGYLYILVLFVLPVAGIGYVLFDDYTPLIVSSCLLGTGIGGMFTLFPVVMTDYFGENRVSEMFGLSIFVSGPGNLLGSPLAGYIIDVTDSPSYVFFLFSGLMLFAAIFIAILVHIHMRGTKTEHKQNLYLNTISVDSKPK